MPAWYSKKKEAQIKENDKFVRGRMKKTLFVDKKKDVQLFEIYLEALTLISVFSGIHLEDLWSLLDPGFLSPESLE